jgi:hypothetical protein
MPAELTRLISKLTEVVYEYKNWKFMKPSKEVSLKFLLRLIRMAPITTAQMYFIHKLVPDKK